MADQPSPLQDIERRLQALLEEERGGATENLQELLETAHKLVGYQSAAPTDELQELIGQQLDETANEIMEILLGWTSLGGGIELGVAKAPLMGAAPRVVNTLGSIDAAMAATRARELPEATVGQDLELVEEDLTEETLELDEEPPRRPVRPPEPASIDQLTALQQHVHDGGTLDLPAVADEDWQELLAELLLGGVPSEDPNKELEGVQKVIDHRERWNALPRRVQCLVIEWLTARLRHLQVRGARDWRVEQGFTVLTHYSRTEQPGFSYGLARSHGPRNDSWSDDAAVHLDELRRMLPEARLEPPNKERLLARIQELSEELDEAPDFAAEAVSSQLVRAFSDAIDAGINPKDTRLVNLGASWMELLADGRFRALRRAVREEQSSAEGTLDRTYDAIPEDWPWWGRTEGRRAVMLGGSPRELNRARLQEEFRFAELVWDPAEHKRNVLQKLRERIRNGGVDLVIVLRRFVGHDTDDVVVKACKEAGTDWVHVEHGYGVNQVQASIERFLAPVERESAK